MNADDVNHSLGLALARLTLNPATGKLRNQRKVGIGIRGALLAELALAERVMGRHLPTAVGSSHLGAGLADSVHAAVAARGPIPWRRWFSHVDADVEAATAALIEAGVWVRDSANPRVLHDTDAELVTKQVTRVFELTSLGRSGECSDLVVAMLAVGAGLAGSRPRPRAMLASADRRLLGTLPDVERRETVTEVVRAALKAMRRM